MKDNASKSFLQIHSEIYPIATKLFIEWVENYKTGNSWDEMVKVDLWDLPLEMQTGVIIFVVESKGGYAWHEPVNDSNVFDYLSSYLLHLEQKIDSLDSGFIH
jgi:hypothetical protein